MTKKLTPELIERHRKAYEDTANELYVCCTCGKELKGNEFYFTKNRATGRGRKCKYCVAQKLKKIRIGDVEARRRKYRKVTNRDQLNGRRKAKYLIEKSLKNETIVRSTVCQMCGKECTTEAHHPNGYDTPDKALDIIWVCRDCHVSIHQDDRMRWAERSIVRISEEYKFRYTPT